MQAQGKKHQAQERPDVLHFDKDTRASVREVPGPTPVQETKEQQTSEQKTSEQQTSEQQTPEQQTPEQQTPEQQTPELSRLQLQLDKTNDRLLRLQAEFDNYRKRTAKERLELILTASEDVIKGMLPVLDDCQRALRTLEKLENADPVSVEGVNLIYSKLLTYLQGRGLKIIESKGKSLDTDFHCAVAKTPVKDKKLKGKIVDVVLEGYTLNGKVIRFANVVVGE